LNLSIYAYCFNYSQFFLFTTLSCRNWSPNYSVLVFHVFPSFAQLKKMSTACRGSSPLKWSSREPRALCIFCKGSREPRLEPHPNEPLNFEKSSLLNKPCRFIQKWLILLLFFNFSKLILPKIVYNALCQYF
jgi:hypothetical protein